MSDWIRDLKNAAAVGMSIPIAARSTSVDGDGVDLGGCEEQAFAVVVAGAITDGSVTVTIEESKNNNSAGVEAADAYAAVSPAASQVFTSASAKAIVFPFKRRKQWVRAVGTVTGATTGGTYGVLVGSMKKFF